jgi:hypothetical protein
MFLQRQKVRKSVSVYIITQPKTVRRECVDIQIFSQSLPDLSYCETEQVSAPVTLDLYSRDHQFKTYHIIPNPK